MKASQIQAERNRIRENVMNPNSLRGTLWYSIVVIVILIVMTGVYMHHAATAATRQTHIGKALSQLRESEEENEPVPHSSINAAAPVVRSIVSVNNKKSDVGAPDRPTATTAAAAAAAAATSTTTANEGVASSPVAPFELTEQPQATPPPPRNLSAAVVNLDKIDDEISQGPGYLKAAWAAVKAGYLSPEDDAVIPVFVTPLFHDSKELTELLLSIDVPVRAFEFVWNSENSAMRDVLEVLKAIPFGVYIHHHPENIGFSGAVNTGIVHGNATLSEPQARWNFIVNADASFPKGNLKRFAELININKLYETDGLVYGPRQDHFAFVITKAAVDTVGLMDETFYPGYMEDIDYHWRVRMSGLGQTISKIRFIHKQSVNMKKPGTGNYKQMLIRAANGWEYGWMKWGNYGTGDIEKPAPPSGWRTPFNIPNASLKLWRVDPGHRACIRTGQGTYHVRSSTCWYNGTGLRESKDYPEGEEMSFNLLSPQRSGALSKLVGSTRRNGV